MLRLPNRLRRLVLRRIASFLPACAVAVGAIALAAAVSRAANAPPAKPAPAAPPAAPIVPHDAGGPVSFRQDVMPVLTRYGCNAGGCHGKLAGQNGVKLSLRGYAPEWDHPAIVRDLAGRRVDYARPEASLIIAKATAQVGHEGGKRFERDSRAAKLLAAWVAARTP